MTSLDGSRLAEGMAEGSRRHSDQLSQTERELKDTTAQLAAYASRLQTAETKLRHLQQQELLEEQHEEADKNTAEVDRESQLLGMLADAKNAQAVARREAKQLLVALEAAEGRSQAQHQSKALVSDQVQQLSAQLRDLQALFHESEHERRRLCKRSMVLTEKNRPESALATRCSAERDILAAKFAVQEAVCDLDRSYQERDNLALQLASKSRSLRRLEKRCNAQDGELAQLRRDSGARSVHEAELKAANRACHAKITMLEQRAAQMAADMAASQSNREQAAQRAHESMQGQADLRLREQQVHYQHIIQELELKLERVSGSDAAAQPHNYISRSEHYRLLEARLATQSAEATAEMHQQLNKARKESQAKAEAQAEEVHRAECQRLASRLENADKEDRKLQDQMQELQAKCDACQRDLQELEQRHQEQASRSRHAYEAQLHEKAMEIATWKQKCALAEERCAQLAEELRALTERRDGEHSEDLAMASELADAKADAKASQRRAVELEGELATQRSRAQQLQEELQACAASLAAAKQDAFLQEQAVQGRLVQAEALMKASQDRVAALEQESAAQARRAERFNEDLQKSLVAAKQDASVQIQALQGELGEAKLNAKSGQLGVQALQSELAALNDSREQLLDQSKAATAAQEATAALAEALRAEMAGLQQELRVAKERDAKGQQDLSTLAAEASQLQEDLKQARAASSTAALSEASSQSRSVELGAQAMSFRQRLADAETRAKEQKERATAELVEAEQIQALLREKLKQKEEEWNALEQVLRSKVRSVSEEMEAQITTIHAQHSAAMRQAGKALEEAQSQAQDEIDGLRIKLNQAGKQLAEEQAEAQQLLTKIQEQDSSILRLQKELELLTQQLNSFQQALTACEGRSSANMQMLRSVVDILQEQLQLPIEQEQALFSSNAAEHAAAVSQLPAALHQYAERWAAENVLLPLQAYVGDATLAASPRRGFFMAFSTHAQLERLMQQITAIKSALVQQESEVLRLQAAVEEAKQQGASLAEEARSSAVAPLRSELANIRASLVESEALYAAEVASVREAAELEQQALQDSIYELQSRLRREADRSERLESDLVRLKAQAAAAASIAYGPRAETQPSHVDNLLSELQDLEKVR